MKKDNQSNHPDRPLYDAIDEKPKKADYKLYLFIGLTILTVTLFAFLAEPQVSESGRRVTLFFFGPQYTFLPVLILYGMLIYGNWILRIVGIILFVIVGFLLLQVIGAAIGLG